MFINDNNMTLGTVHLHYWPLVVLLAEMFALVEHNAPHPPIVLDQEYKHYFVPTAKWGKDVNVNHRKLV